MENYKKGTAKYSLIVTGLICILAGTAGTTFHSTDAAILTMLFFLLIVSAAIRFNQR